MTRARKSSTATDPQPLCDGCDVHVPQLAGERDGPGHLDVQLDRRQAGALRRLQRALDQRGDRLANGRRVITLPDAARWLLEQIDLAQ